MSKSITCYLQTRVGYKGLENGEKILKDNLWWEIIEMERMPFGPYRNCINVLLKFKSKADRELFKKIYCRGRRQYSTKTIRVRISKWTDVPYCRMNLDDIFVPEKVENLLEKQYPTWRKYINEQAHQS